jgi:hypothetical protein
MRLRHAVLPTLYRQVAPHSTLKRSNRAKRDYASVAECVGCTARLASKFFKFSPFKRACFYADSAIAIRTGQRDVSIIT